MSFIFRLAAVASKPLLKQVGEVVVLEGARQGANTFFKWVKEKYDEWKY